MRILIVEDDENKRSQLESFLAEKRPLAKITTTQSLQSGLRATIAGEYELIILDMTMPTFDIGLNEDGGRPQALAGRELIRQMERRDISTPIVVITQFDRFGEGAETLTLKELDSQLQESHPGNYLGAIYYNVAYEDWKDRLEDLMSTLPGGNE
jgi:DNA-binding NarL/FixJ family response regulator